LSGYLTDTQGTVAVKFIVDGTEYTGQVVAFGSKAIEPDSPTKEGLVFKNWADKNG